MTNAIKYIVSLIILLIYLVSCTHKPLYVSTQQQFDSFKYVNEIAGTYKMKGKGYNSSSNYDVSFTDSIVRMSTKQVMVYFPGTYYSYVFSFLGTDTNRQTITLIYNWHPTFNNTEYDTLIFNYRTRSLQHNGYQADSHSWSYFTSVSQ